MVPKLSRHIVTSQYLPVPGPLSGLASPDVHRFVLLLPSWLLLQHHFLRAAFTDHPKIILQYLFSLLFSYIFFFSAHLSLPDNVLCFEWIIWILFCPGLLLQPTPEFQLYEDILFHVSYVQFPNTQKNTWWIAKIPTGFPEWMRMNKWTGDKKLRSHKRRWNFLTWVT